MNHRRPPDGEIRLSQIITTYGPGAMVDLPDHAVLIGGLDHWYGEMRPVHESRLADKVSEALNIADVKLKSPPIDENDLRAKETGIAAFKFPTWFVAQVEPPESWRDPANEKTYRTRPLIHWESLVKGKYLDDRRKKRRVVPIRFIQGCPNGHISDVHWHAFVHKDAKDPCRGQLWLDEGGSGSDLADIFVRCEACRKRRALSKAKIPKGGVLGYCRGRMPWLGSMAREECIDQETGKPHNSRLLIRTASNGYFSQILSVISIPEPDKALREAVSKVYESHLKLCQAIEHITMMRGNDEVKATLNDFTNDEVWGELQRRKSEVIEAKKPIKQAEIETLLGAKESYGDDEPDGDWFARARCLHDLPAPLRGKIERIVLVHRLREVRALIGFTRFEAAVPEFDGDLDLNVQRAPLAQEMSWVPAVENRGEGIFIAFKSEAIESWLERSKVIERGVSLLGGFEGWASRRGKEGAEPPPSMLPYMMLHTLAHLLITSVSLECGYSASSIRERIYAGESGYGILLYTGSPGSEGTLGGLVQIGHHIERHLQTALERGRLCSNDPVCASHAPEDALEERFLHGAACHGCLLIAETSCERRNEYLDRALVVSTVEQHNAEFFSDEGW